MPFYPHLCTQCSHEFEDYYPISKDPKEIKCEKCGGDTQRLIAKSNLGWERKIFNTFVRADDERAEAQSKDHMGPNPYAGMPDELM